MTAPDTRDSVERIVADWQLIDGKRSPGGLAYTAIYWCANTGAIKTETTSDGRFRAGDGPRIRRPKSHAALPQQAGGEDGEYVIRKDCEDNLGVIYLGPEMIGRVVRLIDTGERVPE